jgi:hypothetical protein
VQNPVPPVFDNEQTVQEPKRQCRDGKEVDSNDGLTMVREEGKPALAGIAAASKSSQVSGDRTFGHDKAELQQFAVNLRCSPGTIFSSQAANQASDLRRHFGPPATTLRSPAPVKAKAGAMPADNGLGLHDQQSVLPSRPDAPEPYPEEAIQSLHCRSLLFAFKDSELLA